ncbi:MAG: hypothetical protein OXB84_09305 [Halobacteriovoraceae bacterium]|nr:hypothetical protein [Halobacteriovoraceae bacterium]
MRLIYVFILLYSTSVLAGSPDLVIHDSEEYEEYEDGGNGQRVIYDRTCKLAVLKKVRFMFISEMGRIETGIDTRRIARANLQPLIELGYDPYYYFMPANNNIAPLIFPERLFLAWDYTCEDEDEDEVIFCELDEIEIFTGSLKRKKFGTINVDLYSKMILFNSSHNHAIVSSLLETLPRCEIRP